MITPLLTSLDKDIKDTLSVWVIVELGVSFNCGSALKDLLFYIMRGKKMITLNMFSSIILREFNFICSFLLVFQSFYE